MVVITLATATGKRTVDGVTQQIVNRANCLQAILQNDQSALIGSPDFIVQPFQIFRDPIQVLQTSQVMLRAQLAEFIDIY
ncbi:hypothetical protein [Pseudomonas putida]|uniref:hypothetical protein n=1 Tax=Pseudomonas putida TaxID=303 RepID=UPI003F2EBBEC